MQTPPSPPPQKWSNFHERCPQCWIKWKINFLSYSWLYLQFTGNTPRFSSVLPTKKIVQKMSDLQERRIKNKISDLNFFFELWSILFANFKCFYLNNRPKKIVKSGQICMKDQQCSETNEKSIFGFLFFEIWSIWPSRYILKSESQDQKKKIR